MQLSMDIFDVSVVSQMPSRQLVGDFAAHFTTYLQITSTDGRVVNLTLYSKAPLEPIQQLKEAVTSPALKVVA